VELSFVGDTRNLPSARKVAGFKPNLKNCYATHISSRRESESGFSVLEKVILNGYGSRLSVLPLFAIEAMI
jgi:hypothetical protein